MTTAVTERPAEVPTSTLFSLWPKQMIAFDLLFKHGVNQLLFGGAAGGAKSHFMRALACWVAVNWPGSTFAIFRKLDLQLKENHVKKWMKEIHPYVGGRLFVQAMEYRWPSPDWCWCPKMDNQGKAICDHSSVTVFRHIDASDGVEKHQGASYAAQGPDEATHLSGPDLEYLFTRVRADGDDIAKSVLGPNGQMYDYPGWDGWHQIQCLTANPGGVGQDWCYANFVDPMDGLARFPEHWEDKEIIDGPYPLTNDKGEQVWTTWVRDLEGNPKEVVVDVQGGQTWTVLIHLGPPFGDVKLKRAFVPAKVLDNPAVDPVAYAANLAVGSAEQKNRFLNGDWSYSEDAVFQMLDKPTHVVKKERIWGADLRPPLSWPRRVGQDHGEAKPTACAWVTLEEEGFLICYMEYYKAGPIGDHVREIRDLMLIDGHPDIVLEGDPRIDHKTKGVKTLISVAQIYRHGGEPSPSPDARKLQMREVGIAIKASRIKDEAALLGLTDLLECDPSRQFPSWHQRAGEYGSPMLFFTEDVVQGFRELQNLRHPEIEEDGRYGEGIKDGQPDHFFDALKRVAGPFHQAIARGPRRAAIQWR
jgi:hypothetical protein